MGYWTLVFQNTTLLHGIWIALPNHRSNRKVPDSYNNSTKESFEFSEHRVTDFPLLIGSYFKTERESHFRTQNPTELQWFGLNRCNCWLGSDGNTPPGALYIALRFLKLKYTNTQLSLCVLNWEVKFCVLN